MEEALFYNQHQVLQCLNYVEGDIEDRNNWRVDQSSYDIYRKEIRRYRNLSLAEENALIIKAQSGDRLAFQRLVEANLGFVVHIARKYQNRGVVLNDLISEGNMGLFTAIRKHDVDRGWSLRTYAAYYIRNSILRAIHQYSNPIYHSTTISQNYQKCQRAIHRLLMMQPTPPTDEKIADQANIDVSDVVLCQSLMSRCLTFESICDSWGRLELKGVIAMPMDFLISEEECVAGMDIERLAIDISIVLQQLKPQEEQIVRLAYGIGCQEVELSEIAAMFNVSKERIRQLRDKSIRKLKARKTTQILRDYLE